MLATFYKPIGNPRKKIIMIDPEFPSDIFAVQSWLDIYGLKEEEFVIVVPVESADEANDNIVKAI